MGQYFLSVWTVPVPAAVGVLHVTIALHGGAAGGVVVGAVIEVTVRNASGAVLATAVAREGDTNKFLYEADVQLMAPGDMEVEVAVKDPQASGAARFALLVGAGSAPGLAPGAVRLAALAALVVLLLGGVLAALRRKAVSHAA